LARVLVFLLIGFVVWLLLRGYLGRKARDEGRTTAAPASEDMVACARCGVNMPRSEALEEGGRFICRDPAHCKHAG
jgi:uncharacterized protein